jgi:hypothetical protein
MFKESKRRESQRGRWPKRSHKDTRGKSGKEPKRRGAKEVSSLRGVGAREARSQKGGEPKRQGAKEGRSQRGEEPKRRGARKARS